MTWQQLLTIIIILEFMGLFIGRVRDRMRVRDLEDENEALADEIEELEEDKQGLVEDLAEASKTLEACDCGGERQLALVDAYVAGAAGMTHKCASASVLAAWLYGFGVRCGMQ
jgi:hypothetical protein